MSVQNFDPPWAQHLKHDPNKPLAVNVEVPDTTWDDCTRVYNQQFALAVRSETALTHNAANRPKGANAPTTAMISCMLRILQSEETLEVPCETATTCAEMAERIAGKLGIEPYGITFTAKQGCSYRKLYAHEQVARQMFVKGIESFSRQPRKYADPRVIIGAGHIGLRMAMFLHDRNQDFVVFDRMFRVGGTSWMYQANATSKLQTEYGAYHLDYGMQYKIPTDFSTPWPSRNALLDHFQRVAEESGILPHIRLNTNVKAVESQGQKTAGGGLEVDRYLLTTEKVSAQNLKFGKMVASPGNEKTVEEHFSGCAIAMFPGNLTLPRMETYKGEDEFDGDIGYGMFNEIDYGKLAGENVTIVGHGAFAVENIRTCCEFETAKIFLVCRRANLCCPRVVSMGANRSLMPLSNARFMQMMEPMYKIAGLDPWGYHSVSTNVARTNVQITQKARFGIGDVYFLTLYMGKCELIVDEGAVKRLSRHTVHLCNGRKLDCKGVLKLLGLVGEMDIDRLLKIKEMLGFWVNGDPRMYVVAEPVSVMCTQMGGTSMSPGAYSWSIQGLYFFDYPRDLIDGAMGQGMLPKHKSDTTDDKTPRPCYVVDARHGTSTGMAVGMLTPGLAAYERDSGFIKAARYRLCHPLKKFMAQAKEDWDYYAQKFLDEGFGKEKPYPDYPYTAGSFTDMYKEHMAESGEPPMPCDEADLKLCGVTL